MEEHTLASIYELLEAVAASVRELHERFDRLETNQKTLIETVNRILGVLENHEERIERLEAPV